MIASIISPIRSVNIHDILICPFRRFIISAPLGHYKATGFEQLKSCIKSSLDKVILCQQLFQYLHALVYLLISNGERGQEAELFLCGKDKKSVFGCG